MRLLFSLFSIKKWNKTTNARPPEKFELTGHRSPVTQVVFHPVFSVLGLETREKMKRKRTKRNTKKKRTIRKKERMNEWKKKKEWKEKEKKKEKEKRKERKEKRKKKKEWKKIR